MAKSKKYRITIKTDKAHMIVFAEGERGEILYIAEFPGLKGSPHAYLQRRDRILNDNHHIKSPEAYVVLKEVDQSEGMALFGLPEITPLTAAQHDLRQGIQVVSERALKEIKG